MHIESPNEYIPDIILEEKTGEVWISGESYHEYTKMVFQPVFDWLENYTHEPGRSVSLNFRMSYFNTSSARVFLELMRILEKYRNEKEGEVQVNWYYEEGDIDILESGEKYSEDVNLPFEFIPFQK